MYTCMYIYIYIDTNTMCIMLYIYVCACIHMYVYTYIYEDKSIYEYKQTMYVDIDCLNNWRYVHIFICMVTICHQWRHAGLKTFHITAPNAGNDSAESASLVAEMHRRCASRSGPYRTQWIVKTLSHSLRQSANHENVFECCELIFFSNFNACDYALSIRIFVRQRSGKQRFHLYVSMHSACVLFRFHIASTQNVRQHYRMPGVLPSSARLLHIASTSISPTSGLAWTRQMCYCA